jgi:putative phosphoesterase
LGSERGARRRTLLVSDIHGNFAALAAVAASAHFEDVICLGDVVGYGPEPAACLRWLRAREARIVQGNHDRALGRAVPPRCTPAFQWLADATYSIGETQLSAEERSYLALLPETIEFRLHGKHLLLVHATPADPLYGYRAAEAAAWRADLAKVTADTVLVGHTHLQFSFRVGNSLLINPGSVGQPKNGDPRAAYAILEENAIRFAHAEYDVERTVEGLRLAGVEPNARAVLAEILRSGAAPAGPSVRRSAAHRSRQGTHLE